MTITIFSIIILSAGIFLTSLIWFEFIDYETQLAKNQFNVMASNMVGLLNDRLAHHEQILSGAKGLYLSSEEVTPLEWQNFINSQNILKTYPGIQAVSYIEHIDRDSINEFLKKMKNYDFKNFSIHPEGIREEYYVVSYINPINSANDKAMGFDIYSEQTRRNAIDLAVKTKQTTITGKITLIQEEQIPENSQNGFLMLMPYYESSDSINTKGLFSAVFRMDDFVFSVIDMKQFENLHLKIYDQSESNDNILFDSSHLYTNPDATGIFSIILDNELGNRNWVLQFEGSSPYQINYPLLFAIPIIGYSISILLFYLVISFKKNWEFQKRELKSINKIKEKDQIIEAQQSLLKFTELNHNCCVCVIDMVASTKITSKLSDPKTSQLYSKFLNFTAKMISEHGGIVIKNVGDAILFYFKSTSNFNKNEFKSVVDCCMNLIDSRGILNLQLEALGLPPIDFRISSMYGSVIIATLSNCSSPDIFGTTVNKTFKINRLAKKNGLVVSDILYENVKNIPEYKFNKIDSDIPTEFSYSVFHVQKAMLN